MHDLVKAERFQDLLDNSRVLEFARKMITQSYVECVPGYEDAMRELLEQAFSRLFESRGDDARFREAASSLVGEIFRKQDPGFWFNRLYRDYKRHIKPQRRFQKLRSLLVGSRVLDLGCGDGLISLELQRHGYQVGMTDVLDYRDETAKFLPFVQMTAARAIPYPDRSFDSTIVFAVLHHVETEDLIPLLGEMRRVSSRFVVEEDCYDVPHHLDGLAALLEEDSQLREFMTLSPEYQLRYLMFVDYFANAIAQGLPQMDIPFNFKTVGEWQALFAAQGFEVHKTVPLGFQKGNFNRACHVWFVLDSTPS